MILSEERCLILLSSVCVLKHKEIKVLYEQTRKFPSVR